MLRSSSVFCGAYKHPDTRLQAQKSATYFDDRATERETPTLDDAPSGRFVISMVEVSTSIMRAIRIPGHQWFAPRSMRNSFVLVRGCEPTTALFYFVLPLELPSESSTQAVLMS